MTAELPEALAGLIDGFNDGDLDRAEDSLHPDVEWHDRSEFPDATTHRGRAAVRRVWEEYGTALSTIHWVVCDVEVEGARYLATCDLRTVGRTSGIETVTRLYVLAEIRDGLVFERWSFTDRDRALATLSG